MSQTPTPPPLPRKEPTPGQRLFGAILMTIGGLIAGLCGLCSLVLIGSAVVDVRRDVVYQDDLAMVLVLVAIFGGVPTLIGAALFYAGLVVRRR